MDGPAVMKSVTGGRSVSTSNRDAFHLDRFVVAQRDVYASALAEIRAGQKRSHWMWFVFPQIQGLGSSENARFYAISGRGEAEAYLAHTVLGPRLAEISGALLDHAGKSAHEMFGSPDDLKLKSSMTLFASVSAQGSVFELVLAKFFGGEKDPETLRRLA